MFRIRNFEPEIYGQSKCDIIINHFEFDCQWLSMKHSRVYERTIEYISLYIYIYKSNNNDDKIVINLVGNVMRLCRDIIVAYNEVSLK